MQQRYRATRGAAVLVAAMVAITIAYELHPEPRMVDLVLPGPWQPPVLELVGNHAFTSAEVRGDIPPFVDQDAIDRGLLLVSAFYWDRGYATVKLGTPTLSETALAVPIEEGPRFTMGAVTAPEMSPVKTRPGMMFSRTMIATDRERLETFYQDQSYAFAMVTPTTKIDLASHVIALTFEVERGPRSTFERIDVRGAGAREAEIRRALLIAEGTPFHMTHLDESRRRVIALGFSTVDVSIARGSKSGLVDTTIEVHE